ncbi:MAG: EAL domain-containing protein [Cyanobacteria bacterium P01_G01_bin.54]
MKPPPMPPNEPERLLALQRYAILDTPTEAGFDDLAALAAQVCGTPIALISLIDADRQWCKAQVGLDIAQTRRELSFCAHAVVSTAPLIVPDTRQDPRFAKNPLVIGEPQIRFYAGAPLVTADHHVVGTLCVLAREPRSLSSHQIKLLQALSHQVVNQLELKRAFPTPSLASTSPKLYDLIPTVFSSAFIFLGLGLVGLAMGLQRRLNGQSFFPWPTTALLSSSPPPETNLEPFFEQSLDLLCIANFQGRFIRLNPTWCRTLGYSIDELCQQPFLNFVHPADRVKTLTEFEQLKGGQTTLHFENRYRHQAGHYLTLSWTAWPNPETQTIHAIARDITAKEEQQQQFLATLPDLIFHLDAQGRFLSDKPPQTTTVHPLPQPLIGRTLTEVMPETASHLLLKGIERTLATRELQVVEYQLIFPEGHCGGEPSSAAERKRPCHHDYEARLVCYGEQSVLVIVRDITTTKQVWRDRRQTQRQLQARVRQQAAVAKMGQTALSGTDLDQLMRQIGYQLRGVLKVHYAQILELLPNREAFFLRAGAGWQMGLVGQATITAGRSSQAGYTLLADRPVIVPDLRTETRFSGTAMLHNHKVISGVSVIIPGPDGIPFGVLGVHSCRERTFTEDDINFLQAVAHVLATAIARQTSDEQLRILERVVETSKNGIVLTDATQVDNPVSYVNPAFEAMTGYTAAEMVGQNCRMLQGPDTDPQAIQQLRLAIATVQSCSVTLRNYRKDGTPFWNTVDIAPIFNEQGYLTHFVGIQTDITQRYQAELARQASEEKYRQIVETTTEGIWLVDQDGRTSFVNAQMAQMLGYTPEAMLGKTFLDFMDESAQRGACQALAQSASDPTQTYHDFCFRRQDGQILWGRLSLSALFEDQVYLGSLAMVTNITDRKRAEDQLEYLAYYDSLTDLPNRTRFMEALSQAIETAATPDQFAVCFLDLDNFKIINDGLGHAVGDQLLVALAQRLRHCLRPQDLLARLSGDEFTILLPELPDRTTATALLDRLNQALKAPFTFDDYEIVSSISIGVVFFDPSYTRSADLLRDADTAMYRAKAKGKGQYSIFDQQMRQEVLDHLYLENELRKAIDYQEFTLYYQPIIDLQSGTLCGFEALIRWHHPDHGLVSPDQFIPIAEDTGLILPIGEWVLKAACEQMTAWYQQFPTAQQLTLNINLSAQQFSQPKLVNQLQHCLAKTPVPPHRFKLEITESAVMEDAKRAQWILKQLKDQGLQLCIDDFGTGYSSLSYLHRFPVDTLKIDRSFIHRLESHYEDAQIVQAIIALAHNLKMNVVAEGIERPEQVQYLQPLGCEQGQGFLFSRPLTPAAATQLIEQQPQTPWQDCFVGSGFRVQSSGVQGEG